ncbi:MAG TPA: hypothetical protein VJ973_02715, partial [Christiangramia sp.]|nr:hypothetical protein [Christiangramia sp.]
AYEIGNGEYEVFISKDYLHEGASFAIEILSPSGELIRSSFEELYESPQLDSIYYQIEEFNTNEPGIKRPGVQFYIDFDGRTSSISKIKFEVEETWKFQVEYPIQWTWDGRTLTTYDPPDYSKNIC